MLVTSIEFVKLVECDLHTILDFLSFFRFLRKFKSSFVSLEVRQVTVVTLQFSPPGGELRAGIGS